MKSAYDCVVIGAGPAGGAAASITAQGGLSTLLIERESVPRFHVGESLMPETYWPLQRLGLNDKVKNSGWQVKKSVQFVTANGKESAPFFFRRHDERECSDTWQVERSEFDKMLYDRAAELGAECYDETRLSDVAFDDNGRATGVTIRNKNGETKHIEAKVVVDATGQQSFIANKLGLKEVNPNLKKAAIWGYYRDAMRGEGDNEGATIIMQTESKESWFWFIPLSRGITSIGCVADSDYLLKGRGTQEETFAEELAICPGLKSRLEKATRLGGLRTAKEFSYMSTKHSGDGWVLIGDALGFIDPVYSSGVYFALEMGVRAGDAIVEGFQNDDLSGSQLGCWTEDFLEGAMWVRKLVHAFYSKEFSIGHFMKAHPEHRSCLTDVLIGRIFHDKARQMFEDMDESIKQAKTAMAG
ncbi:NAD(P)/FAD-dependent oxidoreductase [Rhodopirellula sp. MGV]|uniref:NAD(P)/FAD-dependent oxidoreductase n=1 Tax=Rhodopirellula sp. MGV TaxID=2023130 RepID=UPI000B960ABE|nr:NAD(P)/FAD-dependent oxidoreductase [Rhodopirellula sp. MGV]OYP28233.1 alkylhalidase [Rhodopirellula sp. MGV]PNY34235.1 NAD(P)/FAD-dependent oxidoreductase [Rhodopirellula baltica]